MIINAYILKYMFSNYDFIDIMSEQVKLLVMLS